MSLFVKQLLLTIVFSMVAQAFAAPALIPSAPKIAAKGYILVDADSGRVIIEQNADERLEPASLTKMMTSYVADYELAQGNIAMDDITTVSKKAWAKNYPGSSLMFLEVGKKVNVEDLLRGVIISSGNDASVALAEHVAGSTSAFADIMNQHAKLLGMSGSHFVNPHGLPSPDHYSTARDMAILARAAIKDFPEQYKIYSEKYFTYNNIKQTNRNSLLWRDPSVDGLKTGHTDSAGYCLVSSAKKDNMRLIAVVMGANTMESRLRESQKLLSFGFRYYQTVNLYELGEVLDQATIYGGATEVLNIVAPQAVYVTVPRSQVEDLKAELVLDKYIESPINKGQTLGKLIITLGDDTQLEQDVVAERDVEKGGFIGRLWDKLKLFVMRLLEV